MILEGAIAVKAALEAKQREMVCVWLDQTKTSKDIEYILKLAKQDSLEVRKVDRATIDALAFGKTHGGILLEAKPKSRLPLEDLNPILHPRVLWIEGVEDPYNLGQMLRTAYAAGFNACVLSNRDWSTRESILLKSSGGAFEHLALIQARAQDAPRLKAKGYPLWVADRTSQARDYRTVSYPKVIVLAVGGELRGLSSTLVEAADQRLKIVYPTSVKLALGAVSASALMVFEATRNELKL